MMTALIIIYYTNSRTKTDQRTDRQQYTRSNAATARPLYNIHR